MENRNHDPNYRNSDYQNRTPDKIDIEITSRLLALYARTNITNDLDTPLLSDDTETSMIQRIAIGDAIGQFFNDCKTLASEERLQRRFEETGMKKEEYQKLWENSENKFDAVARYNMEGKYARVDWKDDLMAQKNAFAMRSIRNLVDALQANNAFAALEEDVLRSNDSVKLDKETRTDRRELFYVPYDSPVKATVTDVTVGDGTGPIKSYRQLGYDGIPDAYDMMIGIAKTIETHDADNLRARLTGSATRGMATRLLFQKDAGIEFEQAAEKMHAGQKDAISLGGKW